ncbi:hypothetical protein DL763_003744 [Monosporascus cannonballus]|nr:hypothetical protein DL763_003744 [Monosporascus cannonballus]
MSLARHINPEELVERLHDAHLTEGGQRLREKMTTSHLTPYSTKYASKLDVPKYQMPREGSPADAVYQVIRDELDLDGRPNLNLASFVGTYLEPTAGILMAENLNKNLADNDEYPAMLSIHERCVSMLAKLWGDSQNQGEKAVGSATTGSSEAVQLGGLAMKRRWQEHRQAQGKDTLKPNIIMGANAQVALLKFARYFDVEARILPVSKRSDYRLDPDLVRENVDENTIGVFVIMGSTYTGHYEPVEEISKVLDEFEEKTGIDVPIHVDAASGGFVAPFTYAQAGGPKWNFELPRVKSINASGHKYGLVTAGVGWIIWRDEAFLPQHLIFELHYLGGTEKSFTLNFSRPGAHVIVQYYNLVHLGFEGYREIMENCLRNARVLSKSLEATKWYTCLSDVHRKASTTRGALTEAKTAVLGEEGETSADYVAGLPAVSFRFSDEFRREFPHVKQESVSLLMRARQWIIPNYALPPGEDKTEILRICVRENMSLDLLDRLISDLVSVTESLMDNDRQDLEVLRDQRSAGQSGPARKLKDEAREGSKELWEEGKRLAGGIHRTVEFWLPPPIPSTRVTIASHAQCTPPSSIPILLLLVTAAAASPPARFWANTTAANTTLTGATLPPTSPPTPRPTVWAMECMGGAFQALCGALCFCDGSPSCNCHYDPTSRCRQMCECVPPV